METLKVRKGKLLEILKTNRSKHYRTFLEAQKVYRLAVVKELDGMLADARDGVNIRKHVNLVAPEDHTASYDQMIGILELAVDKYVEMELSEYSNYVMDNWGWSAKANRINTAYSSNNINAMYVGEDVRFASTSY